MFRKTILVAFVCLLPAVVHAQTSRGPFELTLGGSGDNGPNANGITVGGNGSLGYFFTDAMELSLRQSAAYSDIGGAHGWDASTAVAFDYHIPITDWCVPYIGGNIGYDYGNAYRDNWEAAPEAGVKFFVNNTTFIYVSAEYQFFFNEGGSAHSAFRNGEFNYGIGVGFRF